VQLAGSNAAQARHVDFLKKSKVTASKLFETVLCWLTMGRLGKEKKIGLS